ncbi:Cyclin-A1-2 [Raphanus sativus]|uniref:Cyclin-A1-2-like n=1 Tax=Raphanus sativus TaxID=3726 RepID=A0A9W3CDN8_RAPSA|nr:cyclin-A1-2-like [Raphanus sativus]KAJ4874303.1 Cyclin-A1-2 [Raphanus sativus]
MSSSSSSRSLPKENPLSRPSVAKTRAPLGEVVNRRNPLGDITNQKNGSRISAPSSTLVRCSNKIGRSKKASKPPKPNAKSNLLVPYEDIIESPQRNAESDLGNDADEVDDIDSNLVDPQLCGAFACDIYEHLLLSEVKKRPAFDYMERVQPNINATMRTILIDWLVEVAEEYRLLPETLYLAVNCLDRYLSGNVITKQNLQLLGVSCMMIASKYEEVCAPQVESFCYITDNTYLRNELLEMESSVLNHLKFELTTPTAKCFLRRFVRAAKGKTEVPSLLFESLASYLSELSLLDYAMLRYAPSLVAASAVFLARYILHPSRKPWSSTLEHYTSYKAKHLEACVTNLLQLCHESPSADVVAVRKKYSQDKYKFAAKKFCPTSLPQELFL